MKRIYLLIALLCASPFLFSQNHDQDPNNGFIVASQFGVTRPLSEMFKENPVDEDPSHHIKISGDRKLRPAQQFPNKAEDNPKYGNDESIMQKGMGHIDGPDGGLKANWQGQTASGFRPYDPSGAAGPNHYVQMINSTTFKVYNKTTGAVTLTATLGNLWSPATGNAGDPIVMYDKTADRWFLAQFGSGNNNIYIAVSTSPDPTGSYYTYTFVSPQFPDYLKFSVWTDGYYMTSNQAQKVFCFERTAMLAGVPGARSVYTSYSPPQGSGFFVPLPGDAADGTLPPAGTPCPIFSYSDNGWGGSYSDAVNIYNMTVNWVPATPTGSITLAANVATASFDASYNASWNDCSQPGTTQKLDGIGGVCMYRAQWKSWGGYNTVVLNWGVKISTSQRSIFWCELRQNQSTGVWSIYQQGIYTPDAATRWMGSMAMDNNGAIGIAYIKSDATSIYPGLYYTGRRSCDPLGTLPVTEVQVVAGTGYQTGTNRVGDYAHTCLDPDGVTFWSTGEYMGGTSGGSAARTRIFSFTIPSCTTDASVSIAVTGGNNPKCPGETTTFTAMAVNGGTTPAYQWKVDGANVGTNSATYSSSTLTAGQVVTCVMTSNLPGVTNNPATSNAITMSVATPVTPAVAIAVTGGSNPTCPNLQVTFTATPTNGGVTPSYQWKVDGVNVGTNSATYSSTTLTNGQTVTCVMTSSLSCTTSSTATSNGIVMSVTSSGTPSVTIAQTSGTNPLCAGASATFTATVTNGSSPTYQWTVNGANVGTNSPTYTTSGLTNGQTVACSVTSSNGCPVLATIGTGTSTNSSTSPLGAGYPTYYGNGRQQWLILASELTALGVTAGNISSLAFNVANTTGDPITLNGYTIKMAQTAATVLTTTFQTPTFTTVFGPSNYTPALNTWNTHSFSTNFAWNGTSNVIVDICFSNQVVGNAAYATYRTQAAFNAASYYQADGAGGAGACSQTTGTVTTYRPNLRLAFGGSSTVGSNNIVMSVTSSLTPAVSIALTTGTNPTCSGSSLTFTATPTNGGTTPAYQWKVDGVNAGTNSATFTTSSLTNGQVVSCVMTSNAACASPTTATSNNVAVTVTTAVTPAVSIALTTGTNPTCSGSSLTFTATPTNGGTTPAYQWKVNGVNAGTNSTTFTTSSLTNGQVVSCVMTSNAACASPTTATSNNVTITVTTAVTPAVSIALTTGTNPTCSGSSLTFTATPTNGGTTPAYQWKVNGVNAGTNSTTFSTSSLTNGQVVSCVMTSNAACASPTTATSNNITVTVTTAVTPAVSIALTTGTNPTCSGSSLTFTATPTNGGTTPAYQWKVDGVNAGTNSATFSTSSLTNGQVVSCVMTSNAACASPTTATSNNITVTVTTAVTPAVSIALTTGTNPTCSGSSLTFTATPTNGGTTPAYQWKVDGVNAGTNSATFTTSSLTNGQVVSCVMTSNSSCASPATATSNQIVIAIQAATAITNQPVSQTICANGTTAFSVIATGTSLQYQWQWSIDGVNWTNVVEGLPYLNSTSSTLTIVAASASMDFTYHCVVTGACGVLTSNPALLTVNETIPTISIALTNGSNPSCEGDQLTFTATTTNGGVTPVYQWKVNGASVGTNSPTYTTTGLTNGQVVTCEMTSSAACANPVKVYSNGITVNVNPIVTPSINIALTTGSNPTCAGSTLTFTATPVNGGSTPVYQWKVDGVNVGTNSASYTTATLTNGQTVTCLMTSAAVCSSPLNATSNSIVIVVSATSTWYQDADGDGYGNASATINSCTQPVGYVNNSGDCNDSAAGVNPGATEICGNGVDDDCDTQVNEGCCTISASAIATNASCAASADGSVNLTVSNGTLPLTYLWSNGAATEDISSVLPGTYSVTVTDANSCVANTSATVASNGGSAPSAPTAISGAYGVCVNQTNVVFSVSPVAGATSYMWTLPNGATGTSTTNTISVNFASNFVTSNICVRALNACGQSAQFCRSIVKFSTAPTTPGVITGPNVNVCAGTTQTYSIAAMNTATSYTWTAPTNATIVSGQGTTSVQVQFASNFGNNGTLKVNASNCIGTSGNRTLVIYNIPATPGTITGPASNVCPDVPYTYSVVAVNGATSYLWAAPSGSTINSGQGTNSVSITFPVGFVSGQVTVKALSACGESALRAKFVSRNPVISSAMTGENYNLCAGGNFTYAIPAVVGATSYSWTVPATCTIVTNSGNSILLSVPAGFTSGSVCVTAYNSCSGSVSSCRSIYGRPAVPASITGPTSVCPGQTGLAYSTPYIAPCTYTWTPPTGAVVTAGQGTSAATVTWGTSTGNILVKASNACGTTSNKSLSVAVVSCMQETDDAENPELVNGNEKLLVFPNPNDGHFMIQSDVEGTYILLNNLGQLVKSFTLNNLNNFSVEMDAVPTGMYFIQGKNEFGIVNQKIIVANQ